MAEEHIIDIVARLHDSVSKGYADLVKSVTGGNKDVQRSNKELEESTKQLTKAEENRVKQIDGLIRHQDKLGKSGSRYQSALAKERAEILQTDHAHQEYIDTLNREERELQKSIQSNERRNKQINGLAASVKRGSQAQKDYVASLAKESQANAEASSSARNRIAEINSQRQAVSKSVAAHDDYTRSSSRVNRETNVFRRSVGKLGSALKRNNFDIEHSTSLLADMRREISVSSNNTHKLERRLALLGRAMMGMMIASVITFMQSFATGLVAVGAEAVAMAGSLAYAAGVLGGAFVTGIAQAIPMVGLLAAAMQRLSLVNDALTAQQALRKASQREAVQDDQQEVDAANQIADSKRGVVEAEQNLREARKEGRRELEDLIAAEREAELAMQGAIISQTDAQRALRDAMQEGDIGGIDTARLDVRQSNFGVSQAATDLQRARADANRGRRGGIEGMEGVKDATKSLADAQRGLADAHTQAAQAASAQTAQEANLQFALQQLTPAERELFKAIVAFKKRFRTEFTPITDIIIESFTRGLLKVEDLLFDSDIFNGLRRLAERMSDAIDKIVNVGTSARSQGFFIDMLEEGRKNLPALTKIATDLFKIFRNIAEGAAPVLHRMLRLIGDELDSWVKGTNNTRRLTEFFTLGLKHLRAWYGILKGVVDLLGAVFGASSSSALQTLRAWADGLRDAANTVRDNKKEIAGFFEEASRAFGYLLDIVGALAGALIKAFEPDSLRGLRDVLVNAVIPGIEQAVEIVGQLSILLGDIFENAGWLANLVQFGVTFRIVASSVGFLVSAFKSLLSPLRILLPLFFRLAPGIQQVILAFQTLGAAGGLRQLATWISAAAKAFRELSLAMKLLTVGSVVGLILTGLALLGDALGLFGDDQEEVKVKVQDLTDAIIAQKEAYRDLRNSVDGAKRAHLEANLAQIRVKDTHRDMVLAIDKYGKHSKQAEEATANYKIAVLDARDANRRYHDTLDDLPDTIDKSRTETHKAIKDAHQTLKGLVIQIENFSEVRAKLDQVDSGEIEAFKVSEEMQKLLGLDDQWIDSKEDVAKASEESGDAIVKAIKRSGNVQTDLNDLLDKERKRAKEAGDAQRFLRDQTDKTTDSTDDQKDSLRFLRRGFGGLIDTLFGTGKQSKELGEVFKGVTNKVLKAFGADELHFDIPTVAKVASGIGGLFGIGNQTGGWIGNRWDRGPDDRLIGVAGGEAVLTGHHQQAANMAFAYANQAGVVPFRNLDDLFSKDRREHRTSGHQRGGYAGNYAKGGRVGTVVEALGPVNMAPFQYDPNHAGGNRHLHLAMATSAQIVAFGRMLQQLGYMVSEHPAFGGVLAQHDPDGYHYTGQAIDINTANDETLAEIRKVVQLLGGAAVGGGAKGIAKGMQAEIARVMVKGPKGPLRDQLQEQSDRMRKVANKRLAEESGKMGGGLAGANVPTGPVVQMAKKMVAQIWGAGQWGPFNLLEQSEAGWNPRALNASSGAAGLAQALPASKYPPGAWPYQGPSSAKLQLQWMMQYIKERYGTPSAAWSFHQANNWYDRGGLVPEFDRGGVVPGPLGMPQYVKAHGGETILPTHKFQTGGRTEIRDTLRNITKEVDTIRGTHIHPIDKITDALTELLREGGLFDDLATQMDAFVATLARKATEWAYRVRHGIVGQIRTDISVAGRTLDDLEEQGRFLNREMDEIERLTEITKRKLQNAENNEQKQKLKTALNNLTERAGTLGDALAQNLIERADAQAAIYDAAIARFEQRISLVDVRQQIAELRDELSGNVNADRLERLYGRRGDILHDERQRIQQEMRAARRAHDTERQRELRQALLDNRVALLENTKSLKEVQGTLGEVFDFNTTPWQLFRQAVLNGMGGLLPAYSAPGIGGPSMIMTDFSAVPQGSNSGHNQGQGKQEININIDEPMEVADPIALSNAIAFKMKQDKTI